MPALVKQFKVVRIHYSDHKYFLMKGNNDKQYMLQIYNPESNSITDRLWDERYDLPIEAYKNNKYVTVYTA